MKGLIRQGDVILIPTTKRPSANAKVILDQGRTILAYGEQTGHSHEVIASAPPTDVLTHNADPVPAQQLFEEPDGSRLLVVKAPCALRHQEHDPADLPIGSFRVVRQVEWDAEQIRRVAD